MIFSFLINHRVGNMFQIVSVRSHFIKTEEGLIGILVAHARSMQKRLKQRSNKFLVCPGGGGGGDTNQYIIQT